MDDMVEVVAKALEPKCRGFGNGNMPMQVAREFAKAAIDAINAEKIRQHRGTWQEDH